uniref:LRR receptor-like serine/threonine-protein kinase GSO1 n=1 Tax=Cajanus cajan TaxID=3821 RepID=A0A151T9K7_CAJCA|nr:LRR receptor-like serine/threonine-protein kinase GSO1 [Cajanus cajan]
MRIHHIFFNFFIPLCSIYLNINISVATCHCLDEQQLLLLQLKDNLAFNPATSKKLAHWNQSVSCCQWNGVTCSMGRVIGLDLSEEFIFGGLNNSSLFKLQYLQNLNLAYNDFNSSIPLKFGMLKNLRFLNLSNAGFHGQVPAQISHMTNLTTLDLSTSLASQNILKLLKPNIGVFLRNLSNMTELYLDGVRISAEGKEWCHALSSLQKLRVLSMSSCNISGPIDSSLATLQRLSVVRLNRNNISSSVPEFFANFSNLNILDLSSCRLSGRFPKGIFQIQTLGVLDISNNQDLHGVLPNFLQHVVLHTMNLSNTNFSGKLPGSISNLKQLSMLDLSNCQFIETLPTSMSELTQLVHLDLSFNKFSGENSLNGKIPVSLFTLPSLQELTLSHNGFDGLLDEFPNISSDELQLIDLSSNKLQGPIPVSIFHLKGLRFLQLSANEFNGTIRLDMIQRLYNLHTLDLSNNQIQGIVPNWIWRFDSLVYLNLSNNFLTNMEGPFDDLNSNLYILDLHSNQLHGSIPTFTKYAVHLDYSSNEFSNAPLDMDKHIPFVYFFSISNNSFQGKIHDAFCGFSSLRLLDLSYNLFNDLIPKCLLRRNSTLRVLNLAGNKLRGYVSDTISSSCNLRFLNLNGNLLGGVIPNSLANCESLQVLNLGNNHFADRFPCFLRNISTLRVLILRSNKLNADHIFAYYVTSNEFGGRYLDSVTVVNKALQMKLIKIPTIFTSLDLSSNHFEGPIPEELMSLRALNVLNLSHNVFSSHIPSSVGNLTHLESLDLSNNDLSGEIPLELASLNFLAYLNLSFNHLLGKIPTGAQMQTFESSSFQSNEGLCGPPLKDCSNDRVGHSPPTPVYEMQSSVDWNFLSMELGLIFGSGIVILPLMFLERWSLLYWKQVDNLLYRIVPQLDFVYEHNRRQRYKTLRWIV